ncbi:hypothetical protein SLS59_002844 [Nothophoma quercina]|uniref:Gfo/Idh/MocA-like oxidoreductase N-terminal domain-containing protein n=1 Tax=Nothophoma quercina TaxID=749835 RepID=A0ABR3RRU7_9PLEO
MAPYLDDKITLNNGDSHEEYLKAPEFQNFAKPPRILVIGAGSRGTAYAEAALQGTNAVITAVCEPIYSKREAFGRKFIWTDKRLPAQSGQHFSDWREWVEYEEERREHEANQPGLESGIDAVFVCVLDEMHEEVVCGIAHLGVDICCEKPMSTRMDSCIRMFKALNDAERGNAANGKKKPIFGICHVLRYSPHNMLLRHLVRDKEVVGDILSVEHCEPVGWWHFSHSYVRGNWRKESTSAPSLLTNAKKIYLDKQLAQGNADWPVKIVNPDIEDILGKRGPEAATAQLLSDLAEDYNTSTPLEVRNKRNYFGRCVWESDNDVCDDQVVTLTWDDDGSDTSRSAKTALFHMIAHTEKQCERRGRIYGTKGEIEYDSTTITIYDFASGKTVSHKPHFAGGGHGGGDAGGVCGGGGED